MIPRRNETIKMKSIMKNLVNGDGQYLTQTAYDRWLESGEDTPIEKMWTNDIDQAARFVADDAPPTYDGQFCVVDAL